MSATGLLYRFAIAVSAVSVLLAGSASAQTAAQKNALLQQVLDASAKIPAAQKKLLSSGAQNFLHVAELLNTKYVKGSDDGGLINATGRAALAQPAFLAGVELFPDSDGTTRISDPALDFQLSVLEGFTQSETSTAWCGNNVVSAYNDSGAFVRTAGVNPGGAASFNGVSVSNNGGRTFKDLGLLNPGTDPSNFLEGDPVVTCASPSQFYYSSLFFTSPNPLVFPFGVSAVSVSSSSTGGASWGAPVIAAAKDAGSHILDKSWSAVDPTNPQRLYVTYTDFDFSGTSATCPNDFRLAIEIVTSADAGQTWTAPAVVDEECGASLNSVQGSNVIVSSTGAVYVAWEFFPPTANNEIHFTKSLDNGKTFAPVVKVNTQVVPNGANGVLQGAFRVNEFPELAVDRTNSASRGTIYVTWSDGRNNVKPDLASSTGTYAYPDVLVAKSTDLGQTFSAAKTVSPTPADFTGKGRDQFFPGIAVDRDGHVGVCYYDRRNDPANTIVDRYCSVSFDHGSNWLELRVSNSNWVPVHDADALINTAYMGDYDALTSDFLSVSDGFFGSFEIVNKGNPDVFAKKFGGF
jgi:hypothetical protein